MNDRKVFFWEPWFFIVFGLFHVHRIWALFDREGYASFWLGIMNDKGWPYFLIMGVMAALCVLGIVTFIKERGKNFWWRWIYLCGGSYVLFDLFAIAAGLSFWNAILDKMFDTSSPYWNAIWGFFILLGTFVCGLGIKLLANREK